MKDFLRLGLYRRNRRDLSIHLRKWGKSSLDRLMEKRLVSLKKSLLSMLVVTVDDKNSSEMFEVAMMSYAIVSKQISAMNIPYFEPVDKILRQRVSVNSFTEQNLYNMTGFSSVDIGELMLHLDVPEEFTLGNGKH